MPLGIIADVSAIVLGGILGTLAGKRMPDKLKEELPMAFSLAAMAIGITSLIRLNSLPAVILALLLGTTIGSLCGFEKMLRHFGEWAAISFAKGSQKESAHNKQFLSLFSIAVILFCTGPNGLYGSIQSSLAGDHSILISKAIMDIFTAAIFAASIGIVGSLLAIPVFIIFITLYLAASAVAPYITPTMFADFTGCGGILVLATGFRIAEMKNFSVADMTPALVLVLPVSHFWSMLPL